MTDEVAEKLISSIIALTKELKKHNDSHTRTRVTIRKPEPAIYFTGAHSQDELDEREARERLSQLRAADEEPFVEGDPIPSKLPRRGSRKARGD